MFKTPEKLSELSKSSIESAMRVAQISMEGAERLARLQLETARQFMEDNVKNAQSLAGIKSPDQNMQTRAKLAEDTFAKVMEYSRSLYEVVTETQEQLTQLMEERLVSYSREMHGALDEAAKNAPAGAEVAVAAMKSTISATTAAIENLTKAAKQMASLAGSSFKSAASATENAVRRTSSAAQEATRRTAAETEGATKGGTKRRS
jgi:phasin family protein